MLIDEARQRVWLRVRDPDAILSVIPTARKVEYKGQPIIAVPHRYDEWKVLTNMGIKVPAPTGYYTYKGCKPFAHQVNTVDFLVANPRAFCLSGMGTGKTRAVLWALDYLKKIGKVRRALIVSPLSTLERVWGDELFSFFPHLSFQVLHGDRERRLDKLSQAVDVYIINHDGIKLPPLAAALQAREDIDLVVIDELAIFRKHGTERYNALKKLVKDRPWVWGLTGTPTPNAPTDAWAQVKLINPEGAPKYFNQFRDMTMRQRSRFEWVPKINAVDVVHRTMQPAIRFAREECIDLPPTLYRTLEAPMTEAQARGFHKMLVFMRTEFEKGEITAANEGVKCIKLLQICCGIVYDNQGNPQNTEATHRAELVADLIEESDAKVIVFVPFRAALDYLADTLAKKFSVARLSGATSKGERDKIFLAFQNKAEPRVLVAQPAAMSHGLSLTAANTIIWYGPASAETYEQANARVTRPGQPRNTFIIHIESSELEARAYARLQNKRKLQGILLEMFGKKL